MGISTTVVVVGIICKQLVQLLVKAATDNNTASAIAAELAGAAGKSLAEKIIPRLVAAYVGPVEEHPEFGGMPDNDREAVQLELVETLKPALDRAFLGQPPYKSNEVFRTLIEIRGHKGSPVGFSDAASSMYQQALDAAVRAVIKVAESAPKWHAANAEEIHAKLDQIADSLGAAANSQTQVLSVLDYVKKSIAQLNDREFKERRDFLEVYYRAIRKTLDRMELYGLDVKEENPARSQRISVAYISLNLTAKGEEQNQGSRSWESVLDALEAPERGRLLVRGDAGMGKTTLLRWAAIAIASQAEPDHWKKGGATYEPGLAVEASPFGPRLLMSGDRARSIAETWRGKVPLLVILRECPDGKFPDPNDFPKFVNGVLEPPDGLVSWLLEEGKALVMIDGLDEIPTGQPTKSMSKGISDLLGLYADRGNLFIATSRPLVMDPGWITKLNFREAVIAPMTDPERDALIQKWHRAVAEQTKDETRRGEIEAMPAGLIQQLNCRPAIARLASVPLLCAMICAQSGPLGSKLPESEFAIINKLAEAMLWVRDRDRDVPKTGTPWDDLTEDKRLAVAARLAHFLIAQGKAAVPREDAVKKITDALIFAGLTAADAKRDAPSILIRLGDRGGIVRAPEGGLVEFAHKTFCEFLSAFQFVEEQDIQFLGDHAPEPGPSNVCRYTAGVKNRGYTEKLINRVLDGTDSIESRGVIALRMKIAAPTLDPEVQKRVKKQEGKLIPPRSVEAAKAIAELGDEVIDRLLFAPNMEVEQQILNATALSQMRSPKAAEALAGYAATAMEPTLIELLCRAVNPFLIPWVRRALTDSDSTHPANWSGSIRSQITDAAVKEWLGTDPGLSTVTTLSLGYTRVGSAGAAALAKPDSGLKALTTLGLGGTQVGDAGAKALANPVSGLKALTTLGLGGTRVGDAGAEALAKPDSGLKALTTLNLSDTQVGDAGAEALANPNSGLKALTALFLGDTRVSEAALGAIRKSHSKISIP